MLGRVIQYIVNPFIYLLVAIALVFFVQGIVVYIAKSSTPEGREEGRRHMVWGIVGLFIIFGVFGLLNIIQGTLLALFQ